MSFLQPSGASITSVDGVLELERRLNDEEPHSPDEPTLPVPTNAKSNATGLDPEVLASLVIQLRGDLARITQQHDDALNALAQANQENTTLDANFAGLVEDLASERARADAAERAVTEARAALQESDAQVHMLRNIVEESRRGVMRLQAETKRKSVQALPSKPHPLDLSQTRHSLTPSLLNSSQSARGDCFPAHPLRSPSSNITHRRVSSLSDYVHLSHQKPHEPDSKGPRPLLLDRRSEEHILEEITLSEQLAAVKAELEQTKKELEESTRQLEESNDSREATEFCVKALREFIADHDIGDTKTHEGGGASPPASKSLSSPAADSSDSRTQTKKSGWGTLRLWRESSVLAQPDLYGSDLPANSTRTPSNTFSDCTQSTTDQAVHTSPSPTPQVGLRRNFSFFSKSTSSPSMSSAGLDSHSERHDAEGCSTLSPKSDQDGGFRSGTTSMTSVRSTESFKL